MGLQELNHQGVCLQWILEILEVYSKVKVLFHFTFGRCKGVEKKNFPKTSTDRNTQFYLTDTQGVLS